METEEEKKIREKKHEVITFTVTCTMKRRWATQFLSMLKYMQKLGSWGSSREVALFADGDGDYRPKFVFDPELLPEDAKPVKENNGDRLYDAG